MGSLPPPEIKTSPLSHHAQIPTQAAIHTCHPGVKSSCRHYTVVSATEYKEEISEGGDKERAKFLHPTTFDIAAPFLGGRESVGGFYYCCRKKEAEKTIHYASHYQASMYYVLPSFKNNIIIFPSRFFLRLPLLHTQQPSEYSFSRRKCQFFWCEKEVSLCRNPSFHAKKRKKQPPTPKKPSLYSI